MVKEFILPEFMLKHTEKKESEKDYFSGYEEFLTEKDWEKRAKETLKEIEKVIDGGLETIPKEIKEEELTEPTQKEILYSSKRGYIVKLKSKNGDETNIGYYLVTKIDDIEDALDKISMYRPVIDEEDGKKLFGI